MGNRIDTFLIGHTERKSLEAAAISKCRLVPMHEFAQPACLPHNLGARLKHKMVGIREHCLPAEVFDCCGCKRFDGCLGTANDEGRSVYSAMWCDNLTGASKCV